MIKAILTKPLDGMAEGTEREFSQADFDRLKRAGAVKEIRTSKKAPEVLNKMAPTVDNKAEEPVTRKTKADK